MWATKCLDTRFLWTDKAVKNGPEKSVTEPLDAELVLPSPASLAIIIISNVFLQISFFIIVPASNEYAQFLGGNSTFSGLTIGIPAAIGGLSLIPLQRYDRGGYKIPLHLSCAFCILGHILYSLAFKTRFLYLILIGRIVNGFAFTMYMYCKRYCSDPRIVGIRRRTTLAGFLVMGQGLGMTAGPFFGGLLYRIGFRSPIFNGFTGPGWIMACVWCIFWICATIWFEDVPRDQDFLPSNPSFENSETSPAQLPRAGSITHSGTEPNQFSLTLPQMGVMVCMCWFAMTCFLILGAWESNIPVFGAYTRQLKWSPFASGNFIALGGITTFPFLVMNVFMARRVEDRRILAFGTSLGLIALFIFLALLQTDKLNYGSVFMCWWAIALGFNMVTTVPISLLSKQFPPSWNNRTSIMIQCSMYTGRVVGAIWGGSGVHVGMRTYVGVEIIFAGVGALLYTILWRELKTKRG